MRPRLVTVAIVVVALLAVWAKVRVEAGILLERARALENEGDVSLAITVYRQTVRWYSPVSGPVAEAVTALQQIALAAEDAGRPEVALRAHRALRAGLIGVRSTYQPYAFELEQAEDAIALLMAREEAPDGPPERVATLTSEHRALLDRDLAPHLGWSLLAVAGFLAWGGGLYRLASRGFDDATGALVLRAAAPWAALSLVAFGLWMAALAQA